MGFHTVYRVGVKQITLVEVFQFKILLNRVWYS